MLIDKIKLEPGEKIVIQTRRHWFIIFMQIFSLKTIALVPVIIMLFLEWFVLQGTDSTYSLWDYTPQIVFFYAFLLTFVWMSIFSAWTNYYLDVLTVTDRRIILVNQKGFFWRNVASFRLERMQDLNIEVNGLIATLLDYGTLQIETAGESDEEFRATDVPSPAHLKSLILQAADNRISTTPNHDGVSHH